MATFVYECPSCALRWEEDRDRSDERLELSKVPCLNRSSHKGAVRGRRIFAPGNVGVVLTGSGWARKDR